MPYILAFYFVALSLFGVSVALPGNPELLIVAWISLLCGLVSEHLRRVLVHRNYLRRHEQLLMFSHQVMPYIHLVHPTCGYHNLNK